MPQLWNICFKQVGRKMQILFFQSMRKQETAVGAEQGGRGRARFRQLQGAGHEYFAVAENGDLYPCHQFVGREGYRLGSLTEGVTNTELPQYFRESHVLNKEKCRDCWARFFCSGGCHANADLFHGD